MMQTYVFIVALGGYEGVWRKLELRADQSLHELHLAILASFDWNADHLYSFFMSGEVWDSESEFTLLEDRAEMPFGLTTETEGDSAVQIDLSEMPAEAMEETLGELAQALDTTPAELRRALEAIGSDDEPAETAGDARSVRVSDLGLSEGDAFLYLYDYGAEHHFFVRCEDIYPVADPDLFYPRLVAAEGEDPPQYDDWDDDEFVDDDESPF